MSTNHPPSPLKSHISADIFLHVPANSPQTGARTLPRIIFLVTGNPGLVAYYHVFLSLLSTSHPARDCIIVGFSLGGFEIEERESSLAWLQFPDCAATLEAREGYYGLEAQITLTEQRVRALTRRVYDEYRIGQRSDNQSRLEVVLLGHSVGAYIVLELIRRHYYTHQRQKHDEDATSIAFDISGATLLTPTVFHIAQSASGRILTPLVTYVPAFATLVAAAARGMVTVVPRAWLRELVRRVTGMPDRDAEACEGGTTALDATVRFLRSERGVRQALEMAGDEMRTIKDDKWGEEVWGAAAGPRPGATGTDAADDIGDGDGNADGNVLVGGRGIGVVAPKLVFYFAKTDHWVADETREELLRVRGGSEGKGEDWRPKMVVDEEDGLVHAWCIWQSKLVAEKVGKWIGEVAKDDEDIM